MKRLPALLAVVIAMLPAPGQVEPRGFLVNGTPIGSFDVPLRTVLERKYHTVIRQQFDFSCGSAALATLLRYHYGRRVREDDVFRGMWKNGDQDTIRRVGFSLLDMKRYLDAEGLAADGYKVTIAKILDVGLPGIALISVKNYKHFVVIKGISANEVLVGDPSTGLQIMRRSEFEKSWNGVFFAIGGEEAFGKRSFNLRGQWAGYSRAPIGVGYADPDSLQALQLTAPFYRDF